MVETAGEAFDRATERSRSVEETERPLRRGKISMASSEKVSSSSSGTSL